MRISIHENVFKISELVQIAFCDQKIKKVLYLEYMLLVISMVKKLGETFYEKQLQKTSQTKFRIEKVIKQKGDKFFLKWKGYDNSLNN